jgi:thiosulfate dehydrogenase [quinone] large subunit
MLIKKTNEQRGEIMSTNSQSAEVQNTYGQMGLSSLAVRLTLGFIFWGGFSRRAIYAVAPADGNHFKLDIDHANFVGNKIAAAYPGSFMPETLVSVIQNVPLMNFTMWLFSFAELAVGLALIFGFATRLASVGGMLLNFGMMLVFGWMGSTCLDEWTMAAFGFGISATAYITGGGYFSIDNKLRNSGIGQWKIFPWLFSGPLPLSNDGLKKLSLWMTAITFLFVVGFYNILYGATYSKLKPRVGFHHQNVKISQVQVKEDGAVSFYGYVNAGPDTQAAYIIKAELMDEFGDVVSSWDGTKMANMPDANIDNFFKMAWGSKFRRTRYGIAGKTGAQATIILPGEGDTDVEEGDTYTLKLSQVEGKPFEFTGVAKAQGEGFVFEGASAEH